jgi:hypothetical protein
MRVAWGECQAQREDRSAEHGWPDVRHVEIADQPMDADRGTESGRSANRQGLPQAA